MSDDFIQYIQGLKDRIEILERTQQISVASYPSDPPTSDGRIYFNTTTHKLKVCENGTWRTITTT